MEYVLKVFGSADIFAFLGIYVILAWSLHTLMLTGQSSLGHAAFFAIGAYLAGVSTAAWNLPLILALGIGALGGAVVGLVFGLPCLRMKGIWLVMATVGLGEITNISIKSIEYVGASYGYAVSFQAPVQMIWATVLVISVFMWLLTKSRFGLTCRAVAQDPTSAEHLGINLTPVKLTAFSVSGGMAALAGGLYAHYIAYLYPEKFDIHFSLLILMWVVLGGRASNWGPIAGVFIYIYFSEFFEFAGKFRDLPFSCLVLLIVLFRPGGIIDRKMILRFHDRLRLVYLRMVKMDSLKKAEYGDE